MKALNVNDISPEVASILGISTEVGSIQPPVEALPPIVATAIKPASMQGIEVTTEEILSTARRLADLLSPDDTARSYLERLMKDGTEENQDALLRLSFGIVEVYGARVEPDYRAAIWNGRTWNETKAKGKRP